jgi:hypothetical protein
MSDPIGSKLPTQEYLDQVAGPVYRALGKSLARWQHVEVGMFLLVHAIMRCDYKYSSTAFYMLTGGNMKLNLLNRLCEAHFSEDDLKNHWKPTYKDLKAAMDFRNCLAHFEISLITDPRGLRPGNPPVALTPNFTDIRESSKPTVKAAYLTELNEAADFYLKLSERLFALVQHHFSLEELRATHLPYQLVQLLTRRPNMPDGPQSPPPQPGSSPV